MAVPRLFGTNGIRGVVGRDIGGEFAYGVGSSTAALFRRGRVVVGRDGRTSSRMLSEAVIGGLLAQGAEVDDCGLITTPALQFLVRNTGASGGVMVTASHNPPEYNGFKVVDYDGIEITREKEEKVEALVKRDSWKASRFSGSRRLPRELLQLYLARLEGQVERERGKLRGMKVVVDTGNGVSSLTTPVLLKRLGCEVLTVNDNIDGGFPGRSSEPGPETLGTLSRMVRESKAELGVAHDGDGDRAIFTDETGAVHWGDRSLALVVDEVLRERPGGKVVTPLNSSLALKEIVGKRKGKLILTRVGSIFVSRTMVETGAVLGGEENGGIFYSPHQPVRDGTMATLLVLKALTRSGLPLSRLLDRLPKLVMAKEKFLCRSETAKRRAMTRLKAKLKGRVTSELDGLRVDVKDRGWVLVRPSGTEPLLRLYAEGWTREDLSVLMGEFKPLVLSSLEP